MASEVKSNKLSPSSGTALQIGDASDTITIPTGATFTITDGLPVASGGTGIASFTAGDVLYATGSTTLAKLGKGTARQGLQTNSGATAPEWANSPQSLMTAAGDVLYASGANTLAKLAKGSDDDVLTLASGIPSWAASAGGGKIGQFVQYVKSDIDSFTDTSFVKQTDSWWNWNGGANALVITPSATNSKILVQGHFCWGIAATNTIHMQMWREVSGGSDTQINLATDGDLDTFYGSGINGGMDVMYVAPFSYVDSPATTSECTYSFKMKMNGNTGYINRRGNSTDGSGTSSCNLIEILA